MTDKTRFWILSIVALFLEAAIRRKWEWKPWEFVTEVRDGGSREDVGGDKKF
jgi:hypothetical protein